MQKIRVLIVDDHTLVRDGLCALLSPVADIEVIGEAANGKEALRMVKRFMPDVVLMDLAMPIMGGLEATRKIRKDFPGTKVLALTQYEDNEYIIPIIEAGAKGFVSKMAAFFELASAIQAVYQGGSFLSSRAAAAVVEECQQKATMADGKDIYQQLTGREREILKLIAEGYTAKEIANMLVLSLRTVEAHKTNLMKKLNVRNKTELIKFAIRKGVITL